MIVISSFVGLLGGIGLYALATPEKKKIKDFSKDDWVDVGLLALLGMVCGLTFGIGTS